jgi:hypothetical protein
MSKKCNVILCVDDFASTLEDSLLSTVSPDVEIIFFKKGLFSKISFLSKKTSSKKVIIKFPLTLLRLLIDYLVYIFRVKKILSNRKVDVVVYCYHLLPAYILTLFPDSKKVAFFHNNVDTILGPIRKRFSRFFFKKFRKDSIIVVSDGAKKELLNNYVFLSEKNITRIYNPINIAQIQKQSLISMEPQISNKFIVTCCRIDEKNKDLTTLINAFKRSVTEHKLDLVIIGSGSDLLLLKNLVQECNLSGRVIFLGHLDNPYPYIKNAEAFILSSKSESFGLVLVEAMCLRTLVISSDCGAGPREILEYGENGVLFSVGDEVRLSSIITQIALSKAEAENQEFISKAFKSVDRFSPETAISIFYKVL